MIEGCGDFRPTVEHLIDEALAALPPAIRDADQHGTRSLYGFKAMFKIDETVPLVKAMLRSVGALAALPNLQPFPHTLQKPRFACATRESIHQYPFLEHDPLVYCKLGQVAAMYIGGSSYIFLCPVFWSLPAYPKEPALTGRCPSVRNNLFVAYPGYEVYHYQSYVIIHELVHFYLQYESLSGLTFPLEQYHINGCVGLTPVTSLFNPLNMQTYVASKYRQS